MSFALVPPAGVEYQLASSETSFIAVDSRSQKVADGPVLRSRPNRRDVPQYHAMRAQAASVGSSPTVLSSSMRSAPATASFGAGAATMALGEGLQRRVERAVHDEVRSKSATRLPQSNGGAVTREDASAASQGQQERQLPAFVSERSDDRWGLPSTEAILLLSAGLLTVAVWFVQQSRWRHRRSKDSAPTGTPAERVRD